MGNEQIPVENDDRRADRVKTSQNFHDRAFLLRAWSPHVAAPLVGVSEETLKALLYRNNRRDAQGRVTVSLDVLFKLHLAYKTYPPIFKLIRPPQGPRRLPEDLPVDLTTTPEDQLRNFRRMRKQRAT